jgi:hypothetical protein
VTHAAPPHAGFIGWHAPASSVYWQATANLTGLRATQPVMRETCSKERINVCVIPRLSLR